MPSVAVNLAPIKKPQHVVVFTSVARAEAFAAEFPSPLDYVNAEMDARDMRLALERILEGSVEQILVDEKSGTPIAPLLEWVKQQPQAGENFGTP
jgi:alpha-acetolactate decarboxylase